MSDSQIIHFPLKPFSFSLRSCTSDVAFYLPLLSLTEKSEVYPLFGVCEWGVPRSFFMTPWDRPTPPFF